MPYSILIVEDDLAFSTMLKTWLRKKGFEVETASDIAKARKSLKETRADVILSDMRLPDEDGILLLRWMKENGYTQPFIIMTGYADIQGAVNAMKNGACDYISKPIQPDILLGKIEEALRNRKKETTAPEKEIKATGEQGGNKVGSSTGKNKSNSTTNFIEGNSEAARRLYDHVDLVAPTPLSVLIYGASGTGKEYVANRIHQKSKRADKPFVAIDCGSIPKDLIASEFFGHVKGAFTDAHTNKTGYFEEANGGTLFLDEIENLGYEAQIQLLRTIQEKRIRPGGASKPTEVDVRIICATNENLLDAIQEGRFREDLYHRINEFSIKMPELKEREGDIMLFANFFLDKANEELERNIIGFDAQAGKILTDYSWPGNIRELRNTVKRAALLAHDKYITPTELNLPDEEARKSDGLALRNGNTEKERIIRALQRAGYNKSKAAALLEIDRKTLYNKLKLYGMA